MKKNKKQNFEDKRCNYNCITCQNRNKEDFCLAKGIENCSKIAPTEFSTCKDYLVRHDLIMF